MKDITIVFIVFASVAIPIIVAGVVYYLKKRLEHKQIMSAIEKGTPLSQIMPRKPQPAGPAWIRYVSVGTTLVIIGLVSFSCGGIGRNFELFIAIIVAGVGAGWLTRGLLHRKYYLKSQPDRNTHPEPKDRPNTL